MDGMGMGNFGFGMGAFGWIFMLFLLGLIIFGVFVLIKWLLMSSGKTGATSKDNALEILEKRYASGEIDQEEFEQKKRDIGK